MKNENLKKYLTDKLSSDESNSFENELENDPFLKESLEGLQMQQDTWNANELQKLEQELNSAIDNKITPAEKQTTTLYSFFKYAAAACIIGIIAWLGGRHFFSSTEINTDAIYAAYYKPLTNPDATIRGENIASDETKAIQAYEKEDYFAAVNYYQKLVTEHPANVKDNLFYGISLLSTNQPEKAIDILDNIQTSVEFHFDIQWYLALAYIKNKQIQDAQICLKELTKEDNYYQTQAQEILNKLNGAVAMKD